ncbi:hypothetical protein [Anditalea andensis]|uniref:Uncharacterized protein n=1 Tax=Anditalea andensis TaxID=1048983 RepID=A0A074LG08_9BACT|nr:hypothetical protein [Anditalea andensis]KEO72722.1 hypothetical protein EL17_18495 [Anditalea andensis]
MVLALAVASAMVFLTCFITNESVGVIEENLLELKDAVVLSNNYRDMQCAGSGGFCLTTFCCVTPQEE